MKVVILVLVLFQAQDLQGLRKKYEDARGKTFNERYIIVTAIGQLKTRAAAEFLFQIIETDPDPNIRANTFTVLVACDEEFAVPRLIQIARSGSSTLRHCALAGLARSSSREGRDLIKAIARDKDPKNDLRTYAISCLERFPLSEKEDILRDALETGDASARSLALHGLAPLKDRNVLETARKIIESEKEQPFLRTAALEPWRVLGGPEAVPVLLSGADLLEEFARKTVFNTLSKVSDDASVEAVAAGLRHPKPASRWMASRCLSQIAHPGVMPALEQALKDGDPEVRMASLEAIAQRRDPRSEEILQNEAQAEDEETACAAVGLLAGYTSEATMKLLVKLSSHRKVPIALGALDALGDAKDPDALPLFEKALKSREWTLRAAAIRGLGHLRLKEAVDLLIDRLAREEGRLLGDVVESLKALTGKTLGYKQSAWKSWWKANRETFDLPERVEGGLAGGPVPGAALYYGIPLLSKRVIFCVDVSATMSVPAGGDRPPLPPDAPTRLDEAKKELTRALKSLPRDALFNIICFETRVVAWQKRLVPVQAHLGPALQMVEGLDTRGSTNLFDPLELAFQDPGVDTICLLSDGFPRRGKFIIPEDILFQVRRLNRARHVVIHCISVRPSPFLKQLAEESGGQYVEKK